MRWLNLRSFTLALVIILSILLLTACDPYKKKIDPNDPCTAFEGREIDNCYLEAVKCSKVIDGQLRDQCIVELAKKGKDVETCNLINSTKTKGYCQEQIAEVTENHLICYDIEDDYWIDNCHYQLSLMLDNRSFCTLVVDKEQRHDCVYKIAIKVNDDSLCDLLEPITRIACMRQIAINTGSTKLCHKMKNNVNIANCIFKVAKGIQDKDLCKEIKIRSIKASCFEFFEE